jgi:hypothetical protein
MVAENTTRFCSHRILYVRINMNRVTTQVRVCVSVGASDRTQSICLTLTVRGVVRHGNEYRQQHLLPTDALIRAAELQARITEYSPNKQSSMMI